MFSKQVLHSFALICFVLVFAKTLTDAKSIEVVQKEVVPSETVEKWECPFAEDRVGCNYCDPVKKTLICDGKNIINNTIKIDLSGWLSDLSEKGPLHFAQISIKNTTNVKSIEFINITTDRLVLENNHLLESFDTIYQLNFSRLVYSNNKKLSKVISKIDLPLLYLEIFKAPEVTEIPEFKFPKSFITLNISLSNIFSIPRDTFKDFSNLEYLYLNHNYLANLGFLSELKSDKLKVIDLRSNLLTQRYIPAARFEKLSYGNKKDRVMIILGGNRIDYFTNDVWLSIVANHKENLFFDFGKTQIECDCDQMKWILDSPELMQSGFDHLECKGSQRLLESFHCPNFI